MPYFLSDKNLTIGEPAFIAGDEADHILLARRAKVGEQIKVQGPDCRRFLASISQIKKHEVIVVPQREISVPSETGGELVLFQSVVASGTLDAILQKATELGATEIVLFNSQFTAARLSPAKFQEKLPRFQKILWEAAKQCERRQPPVMSCAGDVEGVVKRAADVDCLFVFDITGKKLKVESEKLKVGVVIGPEGGLSPEELKMLSTLPNAQLTTLGPLLLKADTAAVVALAVCQNR